MDADTRIRNGTIVSPNGRLEADVLIAGERIAGIVGRDAPGKATREIDATGLWVLPGGVDLHAHTREPGYTHKEDFLSASQAAAAGGITSIVDMPNVEPPTDTVERFEEKRRLAEAKCIVDWGHFVAGTNLAEIPRFAAAGVTGYKIFQVSGAYPHDPRLAMNEDDRLYQAFEAIARTGLPCVVHPFNQRLFELISERALASGKPSNHVTFGEVYTTDVIWRTAVGLLLELQRETGVRLHLVHTHAKGSLELIRAAKARGQRVTAALDPKYYHMSWQDLMAQGPRACPGGYIAEDPERMEAIWRAFNDGTLDIIDADHAPHTLDELKQMETDAWNAPFGSPQYEYLLSVALTDARDGKTSVENVVGLVSERPARILGLYPRKGAVLPGSDADVVLVDPAREVRPTDEKTYSKVHWTPFVGMHLWGAPVLTLRRGEVIAREGEVVGKPGTGRYLPGVAQ